MSKKNTADQMEDEVKNTETNDQNVQEGSETVETEEKQIDPIDELKNEVADWKNKYLRLHAEFDNFRKRTIKERSEYIKNAGTDVIAQILPIVDDFDRAISANEENADIDAVKEGFNLIEHKLLNILSQKGLKAMDSKNTVFDTDLHEAITQIPGDESMKGKVVDVVEKGYYLNDGVLRFAKVVVGS